MRDTFDVCGVSKWRGLYHVSLFKRKYRDLGALLSGCTVVMQPHSPACVDSTPSPPYFRGEPSFLVSLDLVEIYYSPLS